MITERSYSTDHPTAGFWPRQLTAASLLPLEPRLKGNQPWCLACKCLTINQHHKNPLDPDAARALSPSVLTCTSFFFTSRIPLVLFYPQPPLRLIPSAPFLWSMLGICHCATPLSFFLICPTALWQPSISRWHHGDKAPWGAFIKLSVSTPGLYERCRLTEQWSPPPHLDKG